MQMRKHQQVYPVPAAAVQISRREVARVGEIIGVAAVYHYRRVPGKRRDALPLTDVQHAYRVGIPVKLPVRNKQRRQGRYREQTCRAYPKGAALSYHAGGKYQHIAADHPCLRTRAAHVEHRKRHVRYELCDEHDVPCKP